MRLNHIICGWFFLLPLLACNNEEETLGSGNKQMAEQSNYSAPTEALFQKIPSEESGVTFENVLIEDDSLNYYNYTYLYNGSGVASADFNNDGLVDLFFVGALSPNKLYLNEGNLKFRDVSAVAGIEGPDVLKTGVAVHDVNADGWQDIYVCHSGIGTGSKLTNALYINQKDGTFKEEAIARGLDDQSNTDHALFFDYDNDLDLDLFLLNHPTSFKLINNMNLRSQEDGSISRDGTPQNESEGDRLFRNDGNGTFTDVSKEAGIWERAYGLSVTPIDINEDGWMDLYVGNDFIEPDFLYINQKDGSFKNELDKYFPHTTNNSMGADAADINNDGKIDFVSLDMLPEDHYRQQTLMTSMRYDRYKSLEQYDYGKQIMHNMLFIKGKDGKMREIGNLSGIDATDWSWSPLIVDFDLDGLNDIFITNGYRRDLTDLDYMTYYDELVESGEKPEDNVEELLDVVPSHPVPNYMYKNKGNLKFENKAQEWGLGEPTFSNGAAHADLDNDGDEDLVVNNFDMMASVYENRADKKLQNHWLQISLKGPAANPNGIGARIQLSTSNGKQLKYVQSIKGFLSYSSPVITFGLGNIEEIDEMHITWPDGKEQSISAPATDQRIIVNYEDAGQVATNDKNLSPDRDFFGNEKSLLDFTHRENDFIDVKREPLIPRCFSREGPVTEVADFNKDGREDLLIGGAKGQATQIYIQEADGSFTNLAKAFFEKEKQYEDVAFAVEDFNGDGFLDIYVASGGNADPNGSKNYQDRIYFNEAGNGFSKGELPVMLSSTGTVSAADFDGDGDMDVFAGGYVTPNAYPAPPRSYLLINENGAFTDQTHEWSQHLPYPGMVSSSLTHDFNHDGRTDLMLAGEWMPIVWFPNIGNHFGDPTVVKNSAGWWLNLHKTDLDQDGDLDILAGNLGKNTKWSASPSEPMEVYASDFDKNGKFDALITHYVMGEKVVAARRNILMGQMPSLRPDFVKFSTYAKANIEDLVDIEGPNVYHRKVNQLASVWLENRGNGAFILHELPLEAQIAPVYALATKDLNEDGRPDVLAGGNDFHLEIETARADGNSLFLLTQNEANNWSWEPLDGKLNVFNKALRDIDFIKINGSDHMILGFNDEQLRIFPILNDPSIQ